GFGLKDIPEAIRIRNHVLHAFERAMLEADPERRRAELTFVVVGGGPTGVEMAGALSELIRLVLVKDYPRLNVKDVRVLLLEVAGAPLPMMAPVAIQMAETAVANIRRRIAGEPPVAFRYRDPGSLATIGRNAAVAYIRGIGFTGFPAWVVWLVVHIIQLIGF